MKVRLEAETGERSSVISEIRESARSTSLTPIRSTSPARDAPNPVANGRLLAELQPATRLVVVPGAGHNVHQEDPDSVLAAIQQTT